jgi:hypothetical protein
MGVDLLNATLRRFCEYELTLFELAGILSGVTASKLELD